VSGNTSVQSLTLGLSDDNNVASGSCIVNDGRVLVGVGSEISSSPGVGGASMDRPMLRLPDPKIPTGWFTGSGLPLAPPALKMSCDRN
jgi:hypothetical protein